MLMKFQKFLRIVFCLVDLNQKKTMVTIKGIVRDLIVWTAEVDTVQEGFSIQNQEGKLKEEV